MAAPNGTLQDSPYPETFTNDYYADHAQSERPPSPTHYPETNGIHGTQSSSSTHNSRSGKSKAQARQTGPSDRFRRSREKVYSGISPEDILRSLIDREYDTTKLKRTITRLKEDLEQESRRVTEAERAARDATEDFKRLSESRTALQQELGKTSEELALYKYQNEVLRGEVARAQQILRSLEEQRDHAREEAVQSRSVARKLDQERRIYAAREEGRHMGFDAGFRRAQEELRTRGFRDLIELDPSQYRDDDSTIPAGTFGRGGVATTNGTDDFTERTTPPPRHARDEISELSLQFKNEPRITYKPASIPPPPGIERSRTPPVVTSSTRRRPPLETRVPPPPEPIPVPEPVAERYIPPPSPSARTNVTERYHVDVPPAEAFNDNETWGPPPRPSMGPREGPQLPHNGGSRSQRDHPPDNFVPMASADHLPRVPPPNQMGDNPESRWQTQMPNLTRSLSEQPRRPGADAFASPSQGNQWKAAEPWYQQAPTPQPGSFEIERPGVQPSWYQQGQGTKPWNSVDSFGSGTSAFAPPPPVVAGWGQGSTSKGMKASGSSGGLASAAKNTLKGLFRGNSQRKPLSAIPEDSPRGQGSMRSMEVPMASGPPNAAAGPPDWGGGGRGHQRPASEASGPPPSIPPKDYVRKPDVYMDDMFPPDRPSPHWKGVHDIDPIVIQSPRMGGGSNRHSTGGASRSQQPYGHRRAASATETSTSDGPPVTFNVEPEANARDREGGLFANLPPPQPANAGPSYRQGPQVQRSATRTASQILAGRPSDNVLTEPNSPDIGPRPIPGSSTYQQRYQPFQPPNPSGYSQSTGYAVPPPPAAADWGSQGLYPPPAPSSQYAPRPGSGAPYAYPSAGAPVVPPPPSRRSSSPRPTRPRDSRDIVRERPPIVSSSPDAVPVPLPTFSHAPGAASSQRSRSPQPGPSVPLPTSTAQTPPPRPSSALSNRTSRSASRKGAPAALSPAMISAPLPMSNEPQPKRSPSATSLRSHYSRYDKNTYVDPAMYAVPVPDPGSSGRGRPVSGVGSARTRSRSRSRRRESDTSDLEYA